MVVAGNSLTTFRIWFASLFWRAGPGRHHAVTFVPALLLAFILPGCASVNVLMLSRETFTPQTSHVEILERAPTRPYVQIAVLSVDSWWLSMDSKREKILEKAATLGADAVIFGGPLLSSPLPGNRTAEESIPPPPPSLPPKEIEKFIPDDLQSSMQEGMLAGDVRVFLVHGGGHGGGHGHGGHWGSPSGHSGFRHSRHFHGPGFWGYGLYGPGWWGYGPYWGSYYPYYYGSYPYPGYGYTETVTFGTAIHYTD